MIFSGRGEHGSVSPVNSSHGHCEQKSKGKPLTLLLGLQKMSTGPLLSVGGVKQPEKPLTALIPALQCEDAYGQLVSCNN